MTTCSAENESNRDEHNRFKIHFPAKMREQQRHVSNNSWAFWKEYKPWLYVDWQNTIPVKCERVTRNCKKVSEFAWPNSRLLRCVQLNRTVATKLNVQSPKPLRLIKNGRNGNFCFLLPFLNVGKRGRVRYDLTLSSLGEFNKAANRFLYFNKIWW